MGQSYRAVSDSTWQRLKADDDLSYRIDLTPEEPSLMQRIWQSITRWFGSLFSNSGTGQFFKYFFLLAGLALILFALYRLLQMDKIGLFAKNQKAQNLAHHIKEENLNQIDFEEEIARARQAQNWRLVVRLQYLWVLKTLSKQGVIEVKAGKTNHDYSYEIENVGILHRFKKLSRIFDYAWYGGFEISEKIANNCADEAQKLRAQFWENLTGIAFF